MITFQTITSAVSNNFKQSFTGRQNDKFQQGANRFERSPQEDTFANARPRIPESESELGSLDEFFGRAPKPEPPKAPRVIRFDLDDRLPKDEPEIKVEPVVPDYSNAGEGVPGLMSIEEIFGEVPPAKPKAQEPKVIIFSEEDRYPEDVEDFSDDEIEVLGYELPEAEVVVEPVEDEIVPETVYFNDDEEAFDISDIIVQDSEPEFDYDAMMREDYRIRQEEEEYERRRKEEDDLNTDLMIYGVGAPAILVGAALAFNDCSGESNKEDDSSVIEDDLNNDNISNDLASEQDFGLDSFDDFGF